MILITGLNDKNSGNNSATHTIQSYYNHIITSQGRAVLFLLPTAIFHAFQIALLIGIISHALLARALEIDVSPAPVLQGTFVSVGWIATNSGPLAFSLDMICGGKVTVSGPVDRVTATNTTGQVTYGTVCLGDHFAEAMMPSAANTPFTMSSTFQIVSAATPTSGVSVITQTITHTVSPTSSDGAPQSAADG
ncbi:hypothetical protein B0H14DRAFT_2558764 [Mycena olivaceomarginata]|nr:hypothetical protein B0H14DRAFT_2558764 [Mycena olivaceomarginata]